MGQQIQAPQKQPTQLQETSEKQSHIWQRIFLIFLIFIGLIVPYVLCFVFHKIDVAAFWGWISIASFIIGILQWIFSGATAAKVFQTILMWIHHRVKWSWLQSLVIRFPPVKYDYYVSYIDSKEDSPWANWIIWELRNAGYTVFQAPWQGTSYEHETLMARDKAKYVVTLLSHNYVDILCSPSNPDKWLQHFLENNNRPLKDISTLICQRENVPIRLMDALHGTPDMPAKLSPAMLHIPDKMAARNALLKYTFLKAKPHEIESTLSPLPDEKNGIASSLDTTKSTASAPKDTGPRFPLELEELWTVPPHLYSKLCIGREEFLRGMHDLLEREDPSHLVRPVAITGTEGVGKTRIVIEYANRHRGQYKFVLWADASTQQTVIQSFTTLLASDATKMAEPSTFIEKIEFFKNWLQNKDIQWSQWSQWLLIFDGCKDVSLLTQLLPVLLPDKGSGRVLLTTYDISIAHAVVNNDRIMHLSYMNEADAKSLLLQRSDLQTQTLTSKQAEEVEALCNALGYLPLLIEQAGIHISALPDRALFIYRKLYQDHEQRLRLLDTNSALKNTIPWSLSIQSLQRRSLASASLLLTCAYLSSEKDETIPVEIIKYITEEITHTDDKMDILIEHAMNFSLVERKWQDSTMVALIIRRFVQLVILESLYYKNLPSKTQRQLKAEQTLAAERSIKVMSKIFPVADFTNWSQWSDCEKYLPHALAAIEHIDKMNIHSMDAARLLYVVGHYSLHLGLYKNAWKFIEKVASMRVDVGTPEQFPDLATCEHDRGELLRIQGEYMQAKQHYKQALGAMAKRSESLSANLSGQQNIDKATVLNSMGRLYEDWGQEDEAKRQFEEAIRISSLMGTRNIFCSAMAKNNLAAIHLRKHEYTEADRLCKEVRLIFEQLKLPTDHPCVSHYYANLATLYAFQKKNDVADSYYERSIHAGVRILGSNHLQIAIRLNNQALLYYVQNKLEEAEECCKKALNCYEYFKDATDKHHPSEVYFLTNYIMVLEGFPKRTKEQEIAQIKDAREMLKSQMQKKLLYDKGGNTDALLATILPV